MKSLSKLIVYLRLFLIISIISSFVLIKSQRVEEEGIEIVDEDDSDIDDVKQIHKKDEKDEKAYDPNVDINFQSEKLQEKYIEDSGMGIITIYEMMMIAFVVIYIFVCITGKTANDSLAAKWVSNNKNYFSQNYAHIGTGSTYDTDFTLTKESYGLFKFYASGRRNVNYGLITIELCKRFDLVSLVSSLIFSNDKDKLIYEISLSSNLIPHVFCLTKKKEVKYMKKTYPDIDFLTQPSTNENISKSHILLTEDEEISDKFFNDRVFKGLYQEVEKYIDIIYFTDRQTYSKEKHILFCSFNVNSMKDSTKITQFVHMLGDKLSNIDFNTNKLKETEKSRVEYEDFVQKKLLAKQKENEDTKDKDKKQAKNLTKEQQQKLEEKEKKDRLKKQRTKMTKILK